MYIIQTGSLGLAKKNSRWTFLLPNFKGKTKLIGFREW